MKKIIVWLVIFFAGITSFSYADLGGFTIKNYEVNIDVQQDGELQIQENILVHFNEDRHGIYRTIPYLYDNGKWWTYATSIYDINVDNFMFDDYKEGDNMIIKIWDPNVYINWDQLYKISYKVYWGIMSFDWYQELYRNIIWSERDTTIDNVDFTVHFPSELKPSPERFSYYGTYWSTTPVENTKRVDTQTIKWSIKNLLSREAVTVGIKLPANYITLDTEKEQARIIFWRSSREQALHSDIFYFMLLLPVWVFLYLFGKRKKIGDDEPTVDMVHYEAPKWFTPGEVGMLATGRTGNTYITATIYERAIKWYISIDKEEKSRIFWWDDWFIVKKKELPDTVSTREKDLFYAFFAAWDKFELTKRDYGFLMKIKSLIKDIQTRLDTTLFTKESKKTQNILLIIGAAGIVLFSWFWQIVLRLISPLMRRCIIPAVILSFLFIFIFGVIMDKKSPEWNKLYEAARWFKLFMKQVEEPRLKVFLKEDPNYFETMLPYAIAFGLGTQRTKKFETLLTNDYHPVWISGIPNNNNIWQTLQTINSSISTFGRASAFSSGSSGSWGGSSWWGGWGWGGGSW